MMKDYMEKKVKTSRNRPNPARNGSVHRHGHMSSSAAAVNGTVHGRPACNFNLKQQQDRHRHEQNLRRSRRFCGRPFQTEKGGTGEASASAPSWKLKKNRATVMRRPKTHPELLNRDVHPAVLMNSTKIKNTQVDRPLRTNKFLVNVTVARSNGPLRLLLFKDATVKDMIKAALLLYAKEGRKPLLSNDRTSFGIHYSQFSIDCKHFSLLFVFVKQH